MVKPRRQRRMAEMGLHLWLVRTTILVLLGMDGSTVGHLRAVLPLHVFMGARIPQQLDAL